MSGQASAAAKTKLVVSSPSTKAAVPGKISVRAQLNARRSANIVSAKFYVNGKRITTDNRYPFKVKRGVKFDTRNLPSSKRTVRFSVVFKFRKSNGKLKKRTLKKNVRVKLLLNTNPSVGAQATPEPQLPPNPPVPTAYGYPLAFSDDFTGSSVDTSRWNTQRYDALDGWTVNNPPLFRPFHELEGAAYNTNNVSVADGALNLKLNGPASPAAAAAGHTRSTGMVNSKGKFKFKYGYVETRVWVSDCIGCWPTFWIMPENNTWPPEIDIFEFVNPESAQKRFPHSIVHWKPDPPAGDDQHPDWFETIDGIKSQEWFTTYPVGKSVDYMGTGEWHTYGMLWKQDRVDFYVDGELGSSVVGASKLPQTPMYLIYQMAIGDPNKFPAGVAPDGSTLSVDYLRVFSANT